MRKLGFMYNRALLLPMVLAVSFFLLSMGIKAPTPPNPSKPKVHTRAVLETETKDVKADRINAQNQWHAAEACYPSNTVTPHADPLPCPDSTCHIHLPAIIAPLSSRASPVSMA